MRSSAAAFDHFDAPDAKRAPRKSQGSTRGKRKKKGRGQKLNAVAKYAALGAGLAIAGGIMVNALMFQKGRHPAPLFGTTSLVHQAAAKPAPAARPVAAPPQMAAVEPVVAKAPVPEPETRPTRANASEGDPIAQLLTRSAGGANAGDKRVRDAQQALIKLGYPLKASGTMNAATRKALAAFAKLHHLPFDGELDQHVVKALAAASHHHLS